MLFDPFDPATRACPYGAYRRLREAPVCLHPTAGIWFVTGHREASSVLRDARFSARQGQTLRRGEHRLPVTMLSCDPPEHTRLRGALAPDVTARSLSHLAPRIRATANGLVSAWHGRDSVDGVREYAVPLVTDALSALLGIADADQARFGRWAAEVAPHLDPLDPPAPDARASVALEELLDSLADLLAERLRSPADDLLGALVRAYDANVLSAEEVRNSCGLLVVGGFEPLVDLVAMSLFLVLRERGDDAADFAGASVNAIVEESLRYESPIHFAARTPTEDVQLGDALIASGEPVVVLLGAANRDPAKFDDPDRFLHARRPNPHLAFGAGIHGCLGAGFSRLVARIALTVAQKGLPRAVLAAEPTWRESFVPRGLATLPIDVRS